MSSYFMVSLSDPDKRKNLTQVVRGSADSCSMDVTTISGASAFQQQTIQQNVQGSVAAKVLNSQKQAGADALQLLAAASPKPAGNSSGGLDVTA